MLRSSEERKRSVTPWHELAKWEKLLYLNDMPGPVPRQK